MLKKISHVTVLQSPKVRFAYLKVHFKGLVVVARN